MTHYVAILEKEPASLWGIWFPDLPGCVTAAADAESCIAQATEAVGLWTADALEEGESIPPARSLEDLLQDGSVAAALAAGNAAVLVSLSAPDLDLDQSTWSRLDRKAAELGLTRAAFVRETVLEKLAG